MPRDQMVLTSAAELLHWDGLNPSFLQPAFVMAMGKATTTAPILLSQGIDCLGPTVTVISYSM